MNSQQKTAVRVRCKICHREIAFHCGVRPGQPPCDESKDDCHEHIPMMTYKPDGEPIIKWSKKIPQKSDYSWALMFDCPVCYSGIHTRHGNGTRTCGDCGHEWSIPGH